MSNEKRLIDANALVETIHDTADGLADCDQQNAAWALRKYAVRDIMDEPTVDAVEVVRCKDCKYFAVGGADRPWCRHENGLCDDIELDHFCSYGERSTDE